MDSRKTEEAFRDRVIAEMKAQKVSKAGLSRTSGVPYHALDKFLKRPGATTSIENAQALANALGINVGNDQAYEELRSLFYQLTEEQREFLLKSVRGLLSK